MKRRRREKLSVQEWPHVYVGPLTPDGLAKDATCKIVGKRAGGKVIRTVDGKHWLVAGDHVRKRSVASGDTRR